MAHIYAKPSDNTLVLESREYMLRKFNFGLWNEIRIGMFVSFIDVSNDNSQPATESVTLNTAVDRIAFGIKNDDTTTIPGQTGSNFLGASNTTTATLNNNSPFSLRMGQTGNTLAFISAKDTTITSGGTFGWWDTTYNVNNSSSYAAFIGLKFVVANRGLSTQTVTISSTLTGIFASSTYNNTELRTALSAFASPASSSALQWNNGTTAYPLPDCWFIRSPFVGARFRISAYDAILIS